MAEHAEVVAACRAEIARMRELVRLTRTLRPQEPALQESSLAAVQTMFELFATDTSPQGVEQLRSLLKTLREGLANVEAALSAGRA